MEGKRMAAVVNKKWADDAEKRMQMKTVKFLSAKTTQDKKKQLTEPRRERRHTTTQSHTNTHQV